MCNSNRWFLGGLQPGKPRTARGPRNRRGRNGWTLAMVAGLASSWAAAVSANPRTLPFTYPYATQPEGGMEIEQFVDFVPSRALSSSTGGPVWYGGTQFQTEAEYGITDRLELGLYVTLAPSAGEAFVSAPAMLEGNGMKQRLRLRLAEEGEWPVDTSLYLELVENQRELELEGKVLLHRRFGRARAMVNLSAEHEFYFTGEREWVLNPTAGVSFEVTPSFHPGIESWLFAELPSDVPSPRPFGLGPHVYLGPTAHVNLGKLWLSSGAYLRLNERSRTVQPGDTFGSVWFRTLVGVEL